MQDYPAQPYIGATHRCGSAPSRLAHPGAKDNPKRYVGEFLGNCPHIGVIICDKIGNFVVTQPLLASISDIYPQAQVDYFGGPRTSTAETACDLITARCDAFGDILSLPYIQEFIRQRIAAVGPYDLIINLDESPLAAVIAASTSPHYAVGNCVMIDGREPLAQSDEGVDLLHREDWSAEDLLDRYRKYLDTQYIGNIFCSIAHFPYPPSLRPFPTEELPPDTTIPNVLISSLSSRAEKLWPLEHWNLLIEDIIKQGFSIGLIGPDDASQRRYYFSWELEHQLLANQTVADMRGLTIPQQATLLKCVRVCISIDNGIMHLSSAMGTQTVALFGPTSWRLWAPPVSNLHLVLPETACPACLASHSRDRDLLRAEHICMQSISPEKVFEAFRQVLQM
jgi:ADP-heptose:LPS heptosyltransferase